jgi:hypothetical protein
MKNMHRRSIAIVAAGLLVLVGAGGTYAATKSSGSDERKAFLDDVAKRLNVDPSDLTKAMREAFFARLDAAVTAGKLSKAQADAIKKRVQDSGGVPPIGPFGGPDRGPGGPPGFERGGRHHGGPIFGGIAAAAKFLDLTDAQLRDQLASGKSLADIAKDKGKPVGDLKAAIRTGVKSKLDDAVTAKQLTQTQEDEILKELDDHLDDLVNGKPGTLRKGPGRHEGFHGFGGPPPAGNVPGSAPPAVVGGGQI